MQSIYDDIIAALREHDFTIPNVTTRTPYDTSPKTYPLIVVHELVNVPRPFTTVNGETRTTVAYQLDIDTQDCTDADGTVLSAFDAGRRLIGEVDTLLDTTFKLTRKVARPAPAPAPDVVSHLWRGEGVVESSGYTYRP